MAGESTCSSVFIHDSFETALVDQEVEHSTVQQTYASKLRIQAFTVNDIDKVLLPITYCENDRTTHAIIICEISTTAKAKITLSQTDCFTLHILVNSGTSCAYTLGICYPPLLFQATISPHIARSAIVLSRWIPTISHPIDIDFVNMTVSIHQGRCELGVIHDMLSRLTLYLNKKESNLKSPCRVRSNIAECFSLWLCKDDDVTDQIETRINQFEQRHPNMSLSDIITIWDRRPGFHNHFVSAIPAHRSTLAILATILNCTITVIGCIRTGNESLEISTLEGYNIGKEVQITLFQCDHQSFALIKDRKHLDFRTPEKRAMMAFLNGTIQRSSEEEKSEITEQIESEHSCRDVESSSENSKDEDHSEFLPDGSETETCHNTSSSTTRLAASHRQTRITDYLRPADPTNRTPTLVNLCSDSD